MNFEMLVDLIHQTDERLQRRAAVAIDRSLVIRNWLVGLYLVEFEQHGEDKAEYGEMLMAKASARLAARQRKGFSETNLKLFRQFYRVYSGIRQSLTDESLRQIPQTVSAKLQLLDVESVRIRQSLADELTGLLPLSWTHYAFLVQIENVEERHFYEIEAGQQGWSVRELKRQFNTSLYERLALSRDKDKIRQLSRDGQILATPSDIIKTPLVLEFLGLEERASYSESDLEAAIISRLEHFLLELGKGFLFQSRQFRLSEHTLDINLRAYDVDAFDFAEIEDYVRALTEGREYQFEAIHGIIVALLQLIFWGIIAALLVAVIVFALKQLDNPGQPGVAAIVQCKAWQTYNVGVKPVRELFGVMAADRVPEGFFVTTGDYTGDARTLTRQGRLRCVGPDKGGHWEVGKARLR